MLALPLSLAGLAIEYVAWEYVAWMLGFGAMILAWLQGRRTPPPIPAP